jgi:endonuclease/exonuclease/phosphatase family metal-dependent hydrolase
MAARSTDLIAWNANGIRTRHAELQNLLDTEDFTAALICETHLAEKDKLAMAGYDIYRVDRPTLGGGTAIVVRRSCKSHEIPLPALNTMEAVGVQVETPSGPLRLIAAYIRPQAKLHTSDFDKLLDTTLPTIIAGDLNAKHTSWNSRVCNTKGRSLYSHSCKSDFIVAGPLEPTHHSNVLSHRPDVLDIVVYKNIRHSVELQTRTSLSSDHNPVQITIGDELEQHEPSLKFNYRRTDWDLFRSELESRVRHDPLTTKQDLDDAVLQLTTAIFEAIELSAPRSQPGRCSIFDLPDHIKKSIAVKNQARRRWQHHRTADTKLHYNQLEKLLKEEIQEHRSAKWESAVGKLQVADNSVWKMARTLTGKKEPNPPIQGKTHLACSPRDKAEVLAESLEESFTPNAPSQHTPQVEKLVRDYLADHPPAAVEEAGNIETCTAEEVIRLAGKLPNKKAPGVDGITNEIIKELPAEAGRRLVAIFNAALRLQHFPTSWKEAKVVVFPKPGKSHRDPANYRPISLLSGLSKLFEKLILARLTSHCEDHNLLPDQQFGFRSQHSCDHQLLRVTNKIAHGLNTNKPTGVVFLDVAKAFDRVWHEGLLFKLILRKFPNSLVNLVASYLGNRSFHVALRGERSASRQIRAGVPQGSILAPFLFNIFTSDMPTKLPGTEVALYADDAAIYSQSYDNAVIARNLQASLNELAKWYASWRMALNSSKTTATLFARKRSKRKLTTLPKLTLNGDDIEWTPTSKYLGVTLDEKLTWKKHIQDIRQKTSKKLGALYPLFSSKSMPLHTKVQLYKMTIRPVMTYATPTWSSALKQPRAMKTMQTIQNRALKISAGLPMYARTVSLHRDLGVEMLRDHVLKLNKNFYEKLEDNPNPLISEQRNFKENPWDRYNRPISALSI